MKPTHLSRPAVPALVFVTLLLFAVTTQATETQVLPGIPYLDSKISSNDGYECCRLDLYLPAEGKVTGALLWLHGGGLAGGQRDSAATQRICRRFAQAGIIVASAGYRLNPHVSFPAYLEDVAAAYGWLQKNIAERGGDPARVFIGGHSAGAYLALMLALDERYLQGVGIDVETIAGVIAVSGQTTTHFTVRTERKGKAEQIVVDDAAPLYHVKKRCFPFQLLFAGNDMALRAEENRLLAAALRNRGGNCAEEFFPDRTHSTIITQIGEPDDAVAKRIGEFIASVGEAKPRDAGSRL